MSSPPSATPAPSKRSGPGCLVLGGLFLVVVLGGIVIGTALDQPDDPPEERSAPVTDGVTGDGTAWRLDAVVDVDEATCAFLFADDVQLTGGCGEVADDATFGEETVVFGHVEGDVDTVRVILNIGEVVEIDTVAVDGYEGRYFAELVAGDVDVERLDR
jgi:hypothetical protein